MLNIKRINDLVDWANKEKREDFKDFILFMNNAYEKKLIVNTLYVDEEKSGIIKEWSILYNRRFPDFDFEIQLSSYEYCRVLKYLTMESFNKIDDNKYKVTDDRGRIFIIQG